MADTSYQPKVYRKQGGAEFVVASSGTLTIESGGQVDIESGGWIDLESGGYITAASGGYITVAAGGHLALPYQTLTSTQTATSINVSGVTLLTGTTTGPTYLLGAPPRAGVIKCIILNPSSSGATHRAVVSSSAWTGKITHHSATGDKLTLNTSAQGGAWLCASGTTEWRVIDAFAVKDPAIS